MRFLADFHIHSKYSRATSPNMNIPNLSLWAGYKGIGLMGTGDFTHHLWLQELKKNLVPVEGKGLLQYKGKQHFILTAEVSSIYSQNGKGYRVHNVLMAPGFKVVDEINKALGSIGNIASDGRPILGISCIKLAELLFKISPDIMLVPAHIWTPWFSVFGSASGFDSLEEAYGKYTEKITALETGLSSDPAMNWRLSQLDKFSLISNSDSHSPQKIGREANAFECDMNYWDIKKVLETKDKNKFLFTIEFFPEEGKYHFDGHRACGVRFAPEETKKNNGLCPKCKKPLTLGVMYRVEELADRPLGFVPENAVPYKSMVPFDEIIAEALGVAKAGKAVAADYLKYVTTVGPEFYILGKMPEEELFKKLPEKIALGVKNVREGKVEALAGYDGEYGVIKVLSKQKEIIKPADTTQGEQLTLF
jgi:uncharacterized protein (TIGR00375 family)